MTNVTLSAFPLPVWQLGIRERKTRLHPVPREKKKHVTMVRPAAQRAQRGPRPARGAEVTWRRSVTHGVPAPDLKGERERTKQSPARRGRVVKVGIPRSSGVGRRGFDPRLLRRTTRAFFPPLTI